MNYPCCDHCRHDPTGPSLGGGHPVPCNARGCWSCPGNQPSATGWASKKDREWRERWK